MNKTDIRSMTLDQLETFVKELGQLNKYYQETGKDDLF